MTCYGRTLPVVEPIDQDPGAPLIGPGAASMAQLALWRAQSQRDHGMISDDEMSRVEAAAAHLASFSQTIFNPFTGEIRKRNPQTGEIMEPSRMLPMTTVRSF